MMHAVRLSKLRCRSRPDFRTGRQAGRQAGARRRGLQSCQSKAAKAKLQTTANILEVPVQPDILSARRCVALRSFILLLQQHSSHRALVLQLDDLMVLCLARGGEKQVIGPESRPGWPFSANPGMHGVTGCSLSGFDEGRWDTGTLGHWDGTSRRQCCRISLVPGCIQVPTSNLPRLPARLPRPKSPRARPPKAFLDSLHPSNTSLDPGARPIPLSLSLHFVHGVSCIGRSPLLLLLALLLPLPLPLPLLPPTPPLVEQTSRIFESKTKAHCPRDIRPKRDLRPPHSFTTDYC